MTTSQYDELLVILEELEWNHGYAPSFPITRDLDISKCRQMMYNDFELYKLELITSKVLVESKNDIIRRLDAI